MTYTVTSRGAAVNTETLLVVVVRTTAALNCLSSLPKILEPTLAKLVLATNAAELLVVALCDSQ